MIHVVRTVKQCGEDCAKCRIEFYNIKENCDLCDNPEANASELQKLSKKSMIHPMNQEMLMLQMLLLK
jgi:hypothetical protein